MIYVRGQRQDYDAWEHCAGPSWGWAAMKQTFEAIENHGDDRGGPVEISKGAFRYSLTERFIAAGEEMSLARRADLNGEDQEGIGYYSYNIKNGRRHSAARAFLDPARKRSNLYVLTGVEIHRVIFEGGKAVGVNGTKDGHPIFYRTQGEVILSAGALNSPKILQHSGIGPGALLSELGLPVVVDRPAVGANLHDHLGYFLNFRLKGESGTNHRYRGLGLLGSMFQYMLRKTGPMATGPSEVGAFVRALCESETPDTQLHLLGYSVATPEENLPVPKPMIEKFPGMMIHCSSLRFTSRGTVRIGSADPSAPLRIIPNWLSTDYDRRLAVAMVRYARRLVEQPAIAPFIDKEVAPGTRISSDEQILEDFRRRSTCALHAVSTCRMGRDLDAVVDSALRVRGVAGLRVADLSVVPVPISGNTNAVAMATGYRAAQLLKREPSASVTGMAT
jgi:choline dehydrogenase-like flavoprotein